jgi:putative nucleotidyltransferase with HDIG domain
VSGPSSTIRRRTAPAQEILPRLRKTLEEGRAFRARFFALAQLSRILDDDVALKEALTAALDHLRESLAAPFGLLILLAERGERSNEQILLGFDGLVDLREHVAGELASTVIDQGAPLLIPHAVREGRFPSLRPFSGCVGSVILVPLGSGPRLVGVLGVLTAPTTPALGADDVEFLRIAATQIEGVIRETRTRRANLDTVISVVRGLTAALETRDPYTRGHSDRVATYALAILHELEISGTLEFSYEFRNTVRLAAFLHDIGKIGIPDAILQKTERLTPEEFEEVKKHTLKGARILDGLSELSPAVPGVVSHHERFDGKGYPHGLAGKDIPLLGKLLGTADAFDAMTTDRPYKKAMEMTEAVKQIQSLAGTQFDPVMVNALVSAHNSGLLAEGGITMLTHPEEESAHPEIERLFSREIHDLPALPQIVTQILERTRDPKASAREIVRLISRDQALVIKILRLVNSAYYGFSRKIATINLAVAILGYRVVQNVILNIGVMGVFREIVKSRDSRRLSLFEHAIESAVIAKAVAAHIPKLDVQPDEAFTAGLLHDVGKIALDQYARGASDQVRQMQEMRGISEIEAEREVLGFDHAEIGEWIATRWNIPPRLREAILCHHRPHEMLERSPGSFGLVKLVAIANTIAHASAEGLGVEAIHERLLESSLAEAGLDPKSLEEILEAVAREKNDIEEILAPSDAR